MLNVLHELDIEGFRGIKKLQEPIELSKFNVLVGRNNSGKSTVLNALSLLPIPYSLGMPIYEYTSRKEFIIQLVGGVNSLVYAYSGKAKLSYNIDDKKWKIELDDVGRLELSIEDIKSPYDPEQLAKSLGIDPKTDNVQRLVFSFQIVRYSLKT